MDHDARPRARYRALLRLLPGAFRERFGADMQDVFEFRLSRTDSAGGRAWVWMRALADVITLAVREWARTAVMLGKGGRGMGDWIQDMRYALRTLRREPALTVVAVGTLALGIGSSTTTFSVVHAALLKPLPYQQPERLVSVWPEVNFNHAMVRELAAAAPAFEGVAGYSGWTLTLTGEGEPLQVDGNRVSANFFRILGVDAAFGRTLTEDDGRAGFEAVTVLSHDLWVRVFGADPSVVGRTIQLAGADQESHTVVGVMPPDFHPLINGAELWIPLTTDDAVSMADDETWFVNRRIARLAFDASIEVAEAQVKAFALAAREALPRIIDEEDPRSATVESLQSAVAGSLGTVLWATLGAVSLVLLIACANVANLLLARGEARGRDLAVRAALGAGRGRVARTVLAESGVIGGAGGLLGVLAAVGLLRAVVATAPDDFPRIREVGIDPVVMGYALVLTVGATVLAGLVPALRVSRVDATASLGGTARTVSRRSGLLTRVLVGAEVALAVVVVVGSGLMLRSLQAMVSVDKGLETEGVAVFRTSPPPSRYPDAQSKQAYYASVLEQVAALPQVERVGAIHLLPGTMSNWSFPTYPEGVDYPEGTPIASVNIRGIWPDYFETVGMTLLQGRFLSAADNAESEMVVVVNQAFVDEHWPGAEPLGRTISIFSADGTKYRTVGVVANVRQHGLDREPRPEMYYAHPQLGWDMSVWVTARFAAGVPPMRHAPELRAAAWNVDPDVPIAGMDALNDVYGRSAATTRFLALGAFGVFGVTAYAVGRRVPEFGVRIALGSPRTKVLLSALGTCLVPVGVGLVAGLWGAWTAADLLEAVLFGVEATDLATFVWVAGLLALSAVVASLAPAVRASRIDPVRALASE